MTTVMVMVLKDFVKRLTSKALNRENRLECIRQSIRVRFDYRLRATNVIAGPCKWFAGAQGKPVKSDGKNGFESRCDFP